MTDVMDLEAEGILYGFEGHAVKAVGLEIRNAAGGLNDALDVDPTVHAPSDTVYVVLRCDLVEIDHKPIKGDEGNWRRIEVFRATDAAFVEGEAITEAIRTTRRRIEEELNRRKGVLQFPVNGDGGPEPTRPDDGV